MAKVKSNRYAAIVEEIFHARYRTGQREVAFEREDLVRSASKLGIEVPKNHLARYRQRLSEST